MLCKKSVLGNELLKEIISIRVNTLWKMLGLADRGELPGIDDEGASGKFDNKGALFIPGGLIYQDVDSEFIDYNPYPDKKPQAFREQIREAMRYDNATLLYPDGIATGVNLDSGFFSKAARRIMTYKKAAFRRKNKIYRNTSLEVSSPDIIRSHCPSFFAPPFGSRTRISSHVALALIEPAMFFFYCTSELNLSGEQTEKFLKRFDRVRENVVNDKGEVLYSPQIIVCHDSRYSENSYTGMTRIFGGGKFGEFSTFTLEEINKKLLRELKRKKQEYCQDDIFADHNGHRILGVLRMYCSTNPGKRSKQYKLFIVSPEKDLGLQVKQLEEEAREQYRIP